MSLKQTILEYLKTYKSMTIDQLEGLCKREHKKLSNSERRLRELMNEYPQIKATRNSKGAIVGYRWEDSVTWNSNIDLVTPPNCCYSYQIFKTHDSKCDKLKVKDKLF